MAAPSSLPPWLLGHLSVGSSPAASAKAGSVVPGDNGEPDLLPITTGSAETSEAGRWAQDDAVAEDSDARRQAALLEQQRDLILQQEALLVQVSTVWIDVSPPSPPRASPQS